MNNFETTLRFLPCELAIWSGGEWTTEPEERIEVVSKDSRTICSGALYFALAGENFNGHDFVGEAFEKGAVGAVVSSDWIRDSREDDCRNRSVLVVTDTHKALRDIASEYCRKIDPVVIGVTGSVGKSTVKEMIAQVLSASVPTVCTKGNWNNDIGLPLSMLEMDLSTRVGVFEIGTNHRGEIAGLCDVLKPSWGVVTNIAPAHIENFGSLAMIAEEKGCLLSCLPDDGVAFLSGNCECLDILRSLCRCRIVTVGLDEKDDYIMCPGESMAKFAIKERATGEEVLINMSTQGCCSMENAAFAVAVARTYGVTKEKIEDALMRYTGLPMRWEEKIIGWNGAGNIGTVEGGSVKIINDAYNANPLSMRAAITAFANNEATGKRWLVLGDMLELGACERDEHIALGEFIAETVLGNNKWGGLIVVGKRGELIAQGAECAGVGCGVSRCGNNADVIAVLSQGLSAGDEVLLKASRILQFENIINSMEV